MKIMKSVPLLKLIRRFVLLTSFPPFVQIYRLYYEIVTRMVLRIFKRYPAIRAVYLRRGGGKGEIIPVISDLDFAVIEQGMNKEDKDSLHKAYKKIGDFTLVPDQVLEVYDEETFYKIYEKVRRLYRFVEGKETWKLLYGNDYLTDLPDLPKEKLYDAMYHEIKLWWSLFNSLLLETRKNHDENVIRNNVCYKTVSEVLNMKLAFHHATITFSRSEALERSKPHLSNKEKTQVERFQVMARKRFLVKDEGIIEKTKDIVLNLLDGFCREFQTHEYVRSLKDTSQRVDCLKDDMFLGREEYTYMEHLIENVKENWSDKYRGAYIVSGFYFQLDEVALVFEVDRQRLPSARDLKRIHDIHTGMSLRLNSRIHLYFLLPHAAFKIDPDYLRNGWMSILSPFSNSDVFELLSRTEFVYDQGTYYPTPVAIWTPLIKNLLLEMRKELFEKLQHRRINRKDSTTFLRRFWKAAQLCLIERSMQTDEIFYPLTLPSIKQGLTVQGISLPSRLQSLEDAYRDVIGGKKCDISSLMPEAISYLKEIDR